MKTFSIHTLGCKVNQYESQQIAALLRSRGLVETSPQRADLRIINSCSVTVQAASQSRQMTRRMVKLPVLSDVPDKTTASGSKVIVMGCWATSNPQEAQTLPGVDGVITHGDNVAGKIEQFLSQWDASSQLCSDSARLSSLPHTGTNSLPLLNEHQSGRQRAFLKIQDGCDAHCTYCIIPQLRPALYSKPIELAVEEARQLVAGGHVELVLTGIFLGAYGQPTALRRRQPAGPAPLADLIRALCTQVPGLRRLRLSSLEPGDLTSDLLRELASHPQVVPHFHLPLQSGSDVILRKMNRQYRQDDFLRMVDQVRIYFDRPALTTDVIVGFPGETDEEFARTIEICEQSRFIHIHAFSYSPRPGTAAARWTDQYVHGPIVNQRIAQLQSLAEGFSFDFRRQFIGSTAEVIVERQGAGEQGTDLHHGRCERYFPIHFRSEQVRTGEVVRVKVEGVTPEQTLGIPV